MIAAWLAACSGTSNNDLFQSPAGSGGNGARGGAPSGLGGTAPQPSGGNPAMGGAQTDAGASAGTEAFGGADGAGGAQSGLGGHASAGGLPSNTAEGGSAGSPLGEGGAESATGGSQSGGGEPGVGGNGAAGGAVTGGTNGEGGISAGGGVAEGGNASGGSVANGGAAATGGVDGSGGIVDVGGAVGSGGSGGVANGGGAGGDGAGRPGCQKSPEICDGVDNDCNSQIDENACPAKCTGFAGAGRRFMACAAATSQAEAAALCALQGMRLAWLDSADKVSAVLSNLQAINQRGSTPKFDEVYFGATDAEQEGHWHWILGADFWLGNGSGSAVNGAFSNWSSNRPNNYPKTPGENCAVSVVDFASDGNPGQWNDVTCTEAHGALCEAP